MAFISRCPKCGHAHKVREEQRDTRGRCAKCNFEFTVKDSGEKARLVWTDMPLSVSFWRTAAILLAAVLALELFFYISSSSRFQEKRATRYALDSSLRDLERDVARFAGRAEQPVDYDPERFLRDDREGLAAQKVRMIFEFFAIIGCMVIYYLAKMSWATANQSTERRH